MSATGGGSSLRRVGFPSANQLARDSVCPGVHVLPVSVVAVAAAESPEEEMPGQVPMGPVDHTREVPMVVSSSGSTYARDLSRLVVHAPHNPRNSRAKEAARITHRADAEEPVWPDRESSGVAPNERRCVGKPGHVVDRAPEHDRVIAVDRLNLADGPDVHFEAGASQPFADLCRDAFRGAVRTGVPHEDAACVGTSDH